MDTGAVVLQYAIELISVGNLVCALSVLRTMSHLFCPGLGASASCKLRKLQVLSQDSEKSPDYEGSHDHSNFFGTSKHPIFDGL